MCVCVCGGGGGGGGGVQYILTLQVWSLISVKLPCFLFRACEACTGVTFLSFFVRSHSLSYNTQPGSISRQVWKSYSVRAMATEFLAGITGYAGTLYILYIINPRRACAARVTVVVMSVCLSVRYTSGASFRPENAVTYSAGNEGQKICGVFSETAPLPRSSTPSVVRPCV